MYIDIKQELAQLGIDYTDEGKDILIKEFSSIKESTNKDATFCYYDGDKAIDHISKSNAGVILCKKDLVGKIHPKDGQQFYFIDNPRLAFVLLLKNKTKKQGID